MFQHLVRNDRGGDSLMFVYYTNTTYLAARYRPFLRKVAGSSGGRRAVIHCTAGRTGPGMRGPAVIAWCALCHIRQIMKRTNYYRASDNERMVKAMVKGAISQSPLREQ